ncbi:carboxylesterase 1-like [Silene latifolia]|uniref:carboxylesterase 1-like n=1 Tax=Silene latifolia TaxID=37657 RepID=UPI003D780D91
MLQTIKHSHFKLFLLLIFSITLQSIAQNNNNTIDPYKFLHIIPNPNGTITRIKQYYPVVPPNTSFDLSYSKDTLLNPIKNTWVRTYLPSNLNFTQPVKLPVILYVHGGGFILLSAATPNFDRFCALMANRLSVIVVSVEYRLAPENRLPAAYEDVLDALYWLKDGNDDWVKSYGDVSECVLMGESAGGNIAYNVGLKASSLGDVFNPLIIRGMVLIQPFFGGIDRSGSELRLDKTGALRLVVTDLMWDMSLPIGTNRNYWYCNPFSGDELVPVNRIQELGWRVAVVGCDGDPFFDRQVELVEWLRKQGVIVRGSFSKGHFHGVFVNDYGVAEEFFEFVRSVFSQR